MILVTGGTGLVGSHLLYELTSSDYNVRALKRSTSDLSNLKNTFKQYKGNYIELLNKIEWIDGDMSDIDSLKEACLGVSTLYHCAAMVSFNPEDKEKIHNTNIEGSSNIINICIENNIRLCYVSSIASLGNYSPKLGNNMGDPIDENSCFDDRTPHSEYSYSKFLSEELIWEGINKGLNAVILNPSVILGFGHWKTGSSKLITTVAKGLSFYTKGMTGYVDVRDLCRAMHLITESKVKSERFVLSGGDFTYQELFTLIADELGQKAPRYYASSFITGLAWRFAKLKSQFSGKKASLTKETARSSHNISRYNGNKITNFITDFSYTPFKQTIKDICKAYKTQEFND